MQHAILFLALVATTAALNVCDEATFNCTSPASCAHAWPTTHAKHYRTCDVATGQCVPRECGPTIDGSILRCPEGSFCDAYWFKCQPLKTQIGESCDGNSEWEYDDDCFGAWLSCFSNGTQVFECASVDDFRGRDCETSANCPNGLGCATAPGEDTGRKVCADQIFAKAGDQCSGSQFACMGGPYGRGYCGSDITALLAVAPATCEQLRPAHPAAKAACPAVAQQTGCSSSSQCDSGYCDGGECLDSALFIGEPCKLNGQCLSSNCTAGACVASQYVGSDCAHIDCNDASYCTDTEFDAHVTCYPSCGVGGEASWDSEMDAYVCSEYPVKANGESCATSAHYQCQSNHCYRFNATASQCVAWAINEAPADTQCAYPSRGDHKCASGLCSAASGRCLGSGLPVDTVCSGLGQCDFGLFCDDDGSDGYVCHTLESNVELGCTGGHPSEFDTLCGTSFGGRGSCLCNDDLGFDCVDQRTNSGLQQYPSYEWDYVAHNEFDYDAYDLLGQAGCGDKFPATVRADLEASSRTNKCVKQLRSRIDSPGSELEFEFDFVAPMRVPPYWMRRLVGDLDDECRALLASAVCCAACGLVAEGTSNGIPTLSRHNIANERIWTSDVFSGWATPYLDIDCAVPTVRPVWDACSPADEATADMSVKAWAASIGACEIPGSGLGNGGTTAPPGPSEDVNAPAGQLEGGACAGASLLAAVMAIGGH